ncbi:MAG: tyrosine--tRNA ligase [Oscillospiraceae bacterium]|nr:tyrosine--tRNA ligase [Oscillospiraceae bacterium]
MTLFEELKRRGLIAQMSHEKEIETLLNKEKIRFYIGFDATADSLHIGHFLQFVVMKHMQNAGHIPYALLGTGTTLIGDPSGRTDMRQMLTPEQIEYNAERFRVQMEKYLDFSDEKARIVRNGDWLRPLNYLDFMREIGVHFSVNKMLSAECFKSRYEKGLSFFEFNYMLLQSYDFLHLYRTEGVKLQLGGDDQWSNILSGADLIRRCDKGEAFAMTFTLLAAKGGKKMGKTQQGALWIDPDKTSPYDFYQSFRNTDDSEVIKRLKMLTFVPIEEIEELEKTASGAALNDVKERLAFEVTKTVHGEQEAEKAKQAARSIFMGGMSDANMPTLVLSADDLVDGKIGVIDILVKTGQCKSGREARTAIEQGGVTIDDIKITDVKHSVEVKKELIVKKGKKSFYKVKT